QKPAVQFPLPKGEGQGEGEQDVSQLEARNNMSVQAFKALRIPTFGLGIPQRGSKVGGVQNALASALAPLNRLTGSSAKFGARLELASAEDTAGGLPAYLFLGPRGGGDPIRIGLFAGIHGDEP